MHEVAGPEHCDDQHGCRTGEHVPGARRDPCAHPVGQCHAFPSCGEGPYEQRRFRCDEQCGVTHGRECRVRNHDGEAHVPQRRAPEHERDGQKEQHGFEAALLEHVEVGRLPFRDEVLLDTGELRLDHVAVQVDPVRIHHCRDDASNEDQQQVAGAPLVLIAVNLSHPVHGFDEGRDAHRHQPEEESAMEVRPGDHHQGEPVDRARLTAKVAVEPQHLEAGEREGDHLWPWPPDGGAAETCDADHHRGDHQVRVLEAEAPPDQEEPDEAHRAECERYEREPPELEDQVGDDLGRVLGIDPLLAGDREREQILGDDLMVVDHPLTGDQMPEDVRVTTSAHEHAEDHDERGDRQDLSRRDASQARSQGGGHHAEGYSVLRPARPEDRMSQMRRRRCFT